MDISFTMKIPSSFLALLLLALPAFGGLRVPSSVYDFTEIDEASSKARREKKGLAFVYSDRDTTCSLCINATKEALKRLRRHSVVVYLDQEEDGKSKVNPLLRAGFRSDYIGDNYMPKVLVSSPEMDEIWGTLSYKKMNDRSNFRDLEKQIKALVENPEGPKPEPPKKQFWEFKESSKGYFGKFEKLEGDTLFLKRTSGKVVTAPLKKFNEPAVRFAKTLAGLEKEPTLSAPSAGGMVTWTGVNGKEIQAAFVSLDGEVLSLRNAMGSTYRFPLSRLNPESQEKAKAYAQR